MLLTQFDEAKEAVINPSMEVAPLPGIPKIAISMYSKVLFERCLQLYPGEVIGELHSGNGITYIYRVQYQNQSFVLYKSGVGAPVSAANYEYITAMGVETLILFGNCGVLDQTIEDCGIILPYAALRDEGTSYHYVPASDEIALNGQYRELFLSLCQKFHYKVREGKTWTTDALYRETAAKVKQRKAMGAICVEMECSAMAAVSQFRHTDFFQFLYAGDNLDADTWDPRSIHGDTRMDIKEQILHLAFAFANEVAQIKNNV